MAPSEWRPVIKRFLQDHLRRSGAECFVVGLSGGIDSAVAAALCCEAAGPGKVSGFAMPAADSDPRDATDARSVAEHLGTQLKVVPIGAAVEAFGDHDDPRVSANIKARLRMATLYAEAQERRGLVVGTSNKSELLVGYFTKHGDGGSDLMPIGDLYKTQVFELARDLGLPATIIEKPPSAGLWAGQTDESELGMDYGRLDAILKGIEMNAGPGSIAARTGAPLEEVKKVEAMVRRSEHKRHPPLVPKIGARTLGIDWRRSVHWDA